METTITATTNHNGQELRLKTQRNSNGQSFIDVALFEEKSGSFSTFFRIVKVVSANGNTSAWLVIKRNSVFGADTYNSRKAAFQAVTTISGIARINF